MIKELRPTTSAATSLRSQCTVLAATVPEWSWLQWLLVSFIFPVNSLSTNISQTCFSNHSHGEGNGSPLQYCCPENPMDGGAWWAAVHGVAKSQTRLSDFTFTFHFHALEKEMATHSSVLAWRIPGTGEPGGLPFMGSHRVGHDWSDLAAAAVSLTTLKPLCGS